MENIFKFPNEIKVPNANLDGSSVDFSVFSVGYFFSENDIYHFRLLSGMLGIRLEIYNILSKFLGQFQYQHMYEAFADLTRFYMGDLELEFNDDHELVGKIYKYKSE